MKKFFVYAFTALAAFVNYSCSEVDNPGNPTTDVFYYDGKDYVANVVGTFQGEVGTEVSLKLGVYDPFDVYAVDFGDGKLVIDTVCYQNGGLLDEEGHTVPWRNSATEFKGTIAGKGIVTVYGNSDLWYLNLSGGIAPTSFNQEKMLNVVQVNITGANVESIELPALEKMTQFAFNNSPLKSIDVSKATALTSLTINNTSASKYEPQLASIDVSKNTELEYLSLQANTNKAGKLTSLDLTNNTKLTGMGLYVQYNQLTEVKLPECELTTINVQNNKLTSLDLTKLPKLKNLYASDNKLTALDFSKLAAGGDINIYNNELTEVVIPVTVKTLQAQNNKITKVSVENATGSNFKLENNKLTFATLPAQPAGMSSASKTKKFTYAPQADIEIEPEGVIVDFSAQAKAKGELSSESSYKEWIEAETVFSLTAGNEALVEGTDYTIENGKITFLKSQEGVIVKMTNAAFPKLTTGIVTKPFNVTVLAE